MVTLANELCRFIVDSSCNGDPSALLTLLRSMHPFFARGGTLISVIDASSIAGHDKADLWVIEREVEAAYGRRAWLFLVSRSPYGSGTKHAKLTYAWINLRFVQCVRLPCSVAALISCSHTLVLLESQQVCVVEGERVYIDRANGHAGIIAWARRGRTGRSCP